MKSKKTKKAKTELGKIRSYYYKNKTLVDRVVASQKSLYPNLTEQQIFIRTIKEQKANLDEYAGGITTYNALRQFGKQAKKRITDEEKVLSKSNKIDAAYESKRSFYESKIETYGTASKKELFEAEIAATMDAVNPKTNKKYTLKQAIEKFEKSTLVTSEKERFAKNVLSAMRKDKEHYREFKKKIGYRKKIDSDKIDYVVGDQDQSIYRYKDEDSELYIVVRQSPKGKAGSSVEYATPDEINPIRKRLEAERAKRQMGV